MVVAGAAVACLAAADRLPAQLLVLHQREEGHSWQLDALVESSAEAKLEQLLQAEQLDAALLLAESHSLDTDHVRKWASIQTL